MAKYKINMIAAEGCPQCQSMKQTIKAVIKAENLDADLCVYNCDADEAINIALDYGISDVPGCNINGTVIEGENYSNKDLVSALRKLS